MRTEAEDKRFATLLEALAETFGASLSDAQMLGYSMGLADLPIEDVETAAGKAIRTLKFLPKPAELRELAGVLTPAARAVLAWPYVRKAIRESRGRPVTSDDPYLVAAIANMGGLTSLAMRDSDEFQTFIRKDFERIYSTLVETGIPSDSPRHLAPYGTRLLGAKESECAHVVTKTGERAQLRAVGDES